MYLKFRIHLEYLVHHFKLSDFSSYFFQKIVILKITIVVVNK